MPDAFEPAASGRAKCRGCGRAITKGELRFGEALASAYREGESVFWFHAYCAACMRPEKVLALLESRTDEIPERADLEAAARLGVAHERVPRLCRAERASSGRAACRHCRERIDKGAWRLALQIFEEGRFQPSGFVHVPCAAAYFGTAELTDRLRRLSPELSESDLGELAELLRAWPGLAKTAADDAADKARSG
jgi:hypothetical protein